jgi:gamma-glutamylaminecyclotransferase
MCLIIHNPKAKQISNEILDNALCLNPDGFGIFFHDTKEIIHTMSWDESYDLLETGRPFTAHFRYATSGPISEKNCHPFPIDDTFSLMMNGTIDRLVSKKSVDTVELCKILNGLSEPKIVAILTTYACRFALLNRSNGQVTIINNDLWTVKDGVHYSKANCFPAPKCKGVTAATYKTSYRAYEAEEDEQYESWGSWGKYGWDEQDDWYAPVTVEPEPPSGKLVSVAVYGTLKSGHGNHRLLENSYCLGDAYTAAAYPLVIDSLPYLIDRIGVGKRVRVEVYRVTEATLARLDSLEGHPDWYQRKEIQVQLIKGGTVTAWVYMIPDSRSDTHMNDTGIYSDRY